jgi:two-component system nitrogen regulation response regulator NtrX
VERLLILAPGEEVTEADVDKLVGDGGRSVAVGEAVAGGALLRAGTFEEFKQAAERAYLLAKLKEHDWNVSETARTLAMPRSNLYKKIERYRLARE